MKINTDADFYTSEDGYIRSSSAKSKNACSWLYYVQYVLKIPFDSNNDGARMGNVCHSIFECLSKLKRNRKLFDMIVKNGSISHVKPVAKLARKLIQRNNLPATQEIFEKIDQMLLTGLITDFFIDGGEIISAEYRFKHKNASPKYFIIGTMDKIAIKGNEVHIIDYKSSKKKYSGEDKECNVQALLYSLYASKTWPDKTPVIKFIFLQFPNSPVMEMRFNKNVLKGFEFYLEQLQSEMDNFTEEDAVQNLAALQGMPNDGSFSGKLMCGFSKFKGQLKKDGSVMYACPAKWPLDYFKVINKEGKFVCSITKQENYKLQEGESFEKAAYLGCPSFQPKEDKFI